MGFLFRNYYKIVQEEPSLMLLLHAMKSMDIITAVSVYVCSLFTTTNKVSDTHAKIQFLQPLLLMVISLLKLKESSGIAESDEKV